MELLNSLNRDRGITVIMITHEPEMAAFAKRVIHFRDGLVEIDRQNGRDA
jgi:putative ABC transport system ATP-binding protein